MVSISPRASTFLPTSIAPPPPPPPADEEDGPATLRSDGSGRVFTIGRFLDELASDGLDLGLRLLVVDSITTMLPTTPENRIFFTHAASLVALREALERVCARAGDSRVSRVIAPDTSLGAYMKGLYLSALAIARALELFGFRALDENADRAAFTRALEEAAAFHFPDLRDAIRRDLATLRLDFGQTSIVKGLRDAVEKLFLIGARLDGGDAPLS